MFGHVGHINFLRWIEALTDRPDVIFNIHQRRRMRIKLISTNK